MQAQKHSKLLLELLATRNTQRLEKRASFCVLAKRFLRFAFIFALLSISTFGCSKRKSVCRKSVFSPMQLQTKLAKNKRTKVARKLHSNNKTQTAKRKKALQQTKFAFRLKQFLVFLFCFALSFYVLLASKFISAACSGCVFCWLLVKLRFAANLLRFEFRCLFACFFACLFACRNKQSATDKRIASSETRFARTQFEARAKTIAFQLL